MSKRLLIIEDSVDIRENTAELLELSGFTVEKASDGLEGVRLARTWNPDLVICDIMMPNLDGFGVLQVFSSQPELASIPFIFLTSLSDNATLEKVKATEPFGYIVKPFNEKTLKTNIELALHKYQLQKPSVSVTEENDSFFIKNKGELIRIELNQILYLEAYDNYCYLITAQNKTLISHTLKSVEEKLPSQKFLRVHRSFVVQISQISSLQEGFVFIGKHKIPVGKSYREELMKNITLL